MSRQKFLSWLRGAGFFLPEIIPPRGVISASNTSFVLTVGGSFNYLSPLPISAVPLKRRMLLVGEGAGIGFCPKAELKIKK